MKRVLRDRRVVVASWTLLAITAAAALAPWLTSGSTVAGDVLATRFIPPLGRGPDNVFHLLGTDAFGRDLLGRLLFGARVSLFVGIASVGLSAVIGISIGTIAGWVGGWADRLLMAATDIALAIPRVVLVLLLVASWPPSLALVIAIIGLTGWMPLARLVRAEVRKVRQLTYADAALVLGDPPQRLLLVHVLPNAMTPALVALALAVGNAIMLEAGLSFLGLGVQPPTPSWGNMIASGRDALINAPWVATVPGLSVALLTLVWNMLGDGLRDALDPRTRTS